PREESFHVLVRLRISRAAGVLNGVVDVVDGLLPRIENNLLPRVIRVQRCHNALGWVVEERATDAVLLDAEVMRRAEEWLVLPHRLAFVVVDSRVCANPPRLDERPGFGLDFRLHLTPETIRIDKAQLHFGLC